LLHRHLRYLFELILVYRPVNCETEIQFLL
jgi:hypothetical protein